MEMPQYWSPQQAMKAYLNTVHLASVLRGSRSSHHRHHHHRDEPKCMEFLSALAAGNGAKLIAQITSPEGITPLTLALAVAAKQTRGRFIIIIPHDHRHHHDDDEDEAMMTTMINSSRSYINELINPDLKDSIEFFVTGNPYEIIKQFKKIDFLAIDSAHQSHHDHGDDLYNYKLWKNIDLNPMGCLVVVTNLHLEQRGKKKKNNKKAFRGIIGNRNYETTSIIVPVGGDGIELLKIRPLPIEPGAPPAVVPRRYTRFHVTYEN